MGGHFLRQREEVGLFMTLISWRSLSLNCGAIFRIFSFSLSRSLPFSSFLIAFPFCRNCTPSATSASSAVPASSGISKFFSRFSWKQACSSSRMLLACFRSCLFSSKSSSPLSCMSSSSRRPSSPPPQASLSCASFSSLAKGFSRSLRCCSSSRMREGSVQSAAWKMRLAPARQRQSQCSGSVRTTKRMGHCGHFMRNSQILVEWKSPTQVLMLLNRTPFATMFPHPSHRTWNGVSQRTLLPPTRSPSTTTNGFSWAVSPGRATTFVGSKFLGRQKLSARAAARTRPTNARLSVLGRGKSGVEGVGIKGGSVNGNNMKFACGNCLNCCVTVSAEVQYCGTAAECSPESLPLGLAAVLAVAALAVLGVGLFLLYYLWRDRRLGADRQQPTQNEQLREEVVKTEREKEGKAEGGVGRATTFRERRSNKLPKKQTQTERRLT